MSRIAICAALAVLIVGVVVASAASRPSNGGFEKGFRGWTVKNFPEGSGDWFTYTQENAQPTRLITAFPVPPPPRGDVAVVTDQDGPGAHLLQRTVKLQPGRTHRLSFQLAYDNNAPRFFTPNTLRAPTPMGPGPMRGSAYARGQELKNQQFRMDVLKAGAPVRSLQAKHVLARVYRTEVGDPNKRGFRRIRANLSAFAGRRVRLRFAEADNQGNFNVAIDAVKIRSRLR